MVGKVRALDHHLLRRRCVSCGFDGAELVRSHAATIDAACPRCGCDLHERPPRSYAEMEGLLGQPLAIDHVSIVSPIRQQRLINRWLAFIFASLVGLIALSYLAAAALGQY